VRLALVGVGLIATELTRCALRQGHEIVGAVDVDPGKIGRDVGEVLGCAPLGVEVVASVADLDGRAQVALAATGSKFESAIPQFHDCIGHGLDVVSTCEELVYPWRTQPELAARLDEEARRADVTVLGAGINPGFVMDALALAISAPCSAVRGVRIRRVLDAGRRRGSFQAKVGVGLTPEEFNARVHAGAIGHVGLAESVWMISDRLDLGGARFAEEIEPVTDEAGVVAGMRQTAALHAEGEVVRLEMTMAVGVSEEVDAIELDSDPPIRMVLEGGVPGDAGTAGVVVNAVPRVALAPAGLVTVDRLPLLYASGRWARDPSRADNGHVI
jgi:2,4-diaminopentanoate dehydrogenase